MSTRDQLTIVVCTYNRADLLRRMLRTLADSCSASSDQARLLVVDNASTDHTAAVTDQAAKLFPLRRVTEPKPGLSAARNRALQEVETETLWFLDDDVVVTRPWFAAACRALADYPEADWMGGRILPQWPPHTPRWLITDQDSPYKGMLVWYDQGPHDKPLTPQMPSFFGANVMFRKSLFDAGHRFDEKLGPIGKRPRLGDDLSFQTALHHQGRLGQYVPAATVFHPVSPERLRLRYLVNWHLESGLATVRIAGQADLPRRWFGVPRYIYRQALTNLFGGTCSFAAGLLTARPTCWARGLAGLSLGTGKVAAICRTALRIRPTPTAQATPVPHLHQLQPMCKEP